MSLRLSAFAWSVGFLLTALAARAQEPSLFIPEPIHRRMVTGSEPLRFDVYTSGPTLYGLTVTPTEVRDPDGNPLGVSFSVSGSSTIEAGNASHVSVTPLDPAPLKRLGDYRVTLRIEAKTTANSTAKTLQVLKAATLSRVKPEVTVLGIRDRVVRLTRPAPGFRATRKDFPITVRNSSAARQVVTITADPIMTTGDAHEIVGGAVKPFTIDANPGDNAVSLEIVAAATGTLQSKLHVAIAGHEEIEEVPFKLVVSDAPPLPFLAIFFGVFCAFLLHFLATRIRPEQANRFRLLQLRQLLERLRLRSADRRAEIDKMLALLHDLALSNSAGVVSEVQARLGTLAQEIDALEKQIEADRQAVQQKIREVRASLDTVRGKANPADVAEATAGMLRLETLAGQNRHAEALAGLMHVAEIVAAMAAAAKRGSRPDEDETVDVSPAAAAGVIRILTALASRTTRREVVFEVAGVASDAALRWSFGDGDAEVHQGPRARHSYAQSGMFSITAELPDGGIATTEIDIGLSDLERGAVDAAKRLVLIDALLSLIALIVATTTGLLMLYAGKTFGSLASYLEAFLWGFGIDGSVRGFGNVFKKLMSDS